MLKSTQVDNIIAVVNGSSDNTMKEIKSLKLKMLKSFTLNKSWALMCQGLLGHITHIKVVQMQ